MLSTAKVGSCPAEGRLSVCVIEDEDSPLGSAPSYLAHFLDFELKPVPNRAAPLEEVSKRVISVKILAAKINWRKTDERRPSGGLGQTLFDFDSQPEDLLSRYNIPVGWITYAS